eukprot:6307948-Alexandrium_andersonii.AAC.1
MCLRAGHPPPCPTHNSLRASMLVKSVKLVLSRCTNCAIIADPRGLRSRFGSLVAPIGARPSFGKRTMCNNT